MVAKIAAYCSSIEKRCDDAIIAIIGYFPLAAATIHLTSNGRNHATMWPADALILALLLKNSRRDWPVILVAGWIANLLANVVTREWMSGLIAYGAINMAQTGLAAWLLTRSHRCDNPLADPPAMIRFALYAGIVAPALGATLGSIVTIFNFDQPFGPSFVRWYISNALGLLIVTPVLMAIFDGSLVRGFKERAAADRWEAAGLHTLHLIVTCGVFMQSRLPLMFLPISTALALAFRLGRLGAVLGTLVVAVIGGTATFMGFGRIALIDTGVAEQELMFQLYLAVLLATTLPVAAMVASKAEALEQLAEREAALHLMMAHSPDAVLSFDVAGVCRWADGPLASYLGVEPAAMRGRSLDVMALHEPALAEKVRAYGRGDMDGTALFAFSPLLRPHLTLEATIAPLRQDGVSVGNIVTVRNAAERKAKEAASRAKTQTDELTGLLNYHGFRKHLRTVLADKSRPVTLALVDVDRFRSINDIHGAVVGDAVLAEVSKRMKAAMRADDAVARLGGDEFAIVLRCDLDMALKVCERMVETVRESPVFGDGVLSVLASVSCGIAQYHAGMSSDELFDASDAALHDVKNGGRNGVRVAA